MRLRYILIKHSHENTKHNETSTIRTSTIGFKNVHVTIILNYMYVASYVCTIIFLIS